jgi:glutamine amidotransferase
MVHLLAAIATDAEHMPSLLYSMRNLLVSDANSEEDTWGVGYYADERALIIRKPGGLLPARSFYELASSVRSRVLVASVHDEGRPTTHAAPYRFRRWLFSAYGDLSTLSALKPKILEALPDFIRSEVTSGGAGDLAFGMFLRELHSRGLLGDTLVEGKELAEAVKRTVDAMAMLAAEAGAPPPAASYAATNGRTVIAARMGPAIHWKRQEGLEGLPEGPLDPTLKDFQRVADALKNFRAIVLASELGAARPSDWTELAPGTVSWIDRTLNVFSL